MTRFRLILRSLWHFRAVNASSVAALAVAVAVLAGALVIGDSVRGSLRQMALVRLGPVRQVMMPMRFFDADLARRIEQREAFNTDGALLPAIILRGAIHRESDNTTTAVQILAADELLSVSPGSCIISRAAADALGITVAGEEVYFTFTAADGDKSIAARRSRAETLAGVRCRVQRIAEAGTFEAGFDLHPSQRPVLNAWMNLTALQRAIGQDGRANAIMGVGAELSLRNFNPTLRQIIEARDAGLILDEKSGALTSEGTYLIPAAERAAEAAGRDLGISPQRVSVHLAQRIAGDGIARSFYAVIAAVSDLAIPDGQAAINEWTANRLGLRGGQTLHLTLYQRRDDGTIGLGEPTAYRLARILPMTGLGADPSLTPRYKGLTDADSIADWHPPTGLEIDQSLVTPEDEKYWDDHRAAPKLFVNLADARALWGGPAGYLTSIRVPPARARQFTAAMLKHLDPEDVGLSFQPVRDRQLGAAEGNTPFEGLFLGFSIFLIAAALLLAIMLQRLGVQQRSRQLGLLAALGFNSTARQRIILAEGAILCLIASAAGIPLAIIHARLMLLGLTTWWLDAVGTTALTLHVHTATLATGAALGFAVSMFALLAALRRLGCVVPARLLADDMIAAEQPVGGSRRWILPATSTAAGALGLAAIGTVAIGRLSSAFGFLAGGMFLLGALLLGVRVALRNGGRHRATSLPALAWRNAASSTGRSTLSVAMMALAGFILITVGSMRRGDVTNPRDRSSGTGGFQLIVQADIALPASPQTRAGRNLLGIRDMNNPLWTRCRFYPLRTAAGQDASCLNLLRPDSPGLVAISEQMREHRPFHFARRTRDSAHPWEEIAASRNADQAIPVIADDETARYILKVNPGDSWTIPLLDGRRLSVRLIATIEASIFQGVLLMGEAAFRGLLPARDGFGAMLIEVPADTDIQPLSRLLASELSDYGPTIQTTSQRLAGYQQVANTYLATFQLLGGMGMLLGTVGLAASLVRGVFERRGQFALLAALGFSPTRRRLLIRAESSLLLLLGLGIGTLCALIATIPAWTAGHAINWTQLGIALAAIFSFGLASLAAASRIAGRRITPALLREE